MKRKTGRRIVSMVLAAQLPLSSAAQAAAPLITSTAAQDTLRQQPISFKEFLRTEEGNVGRYALTQEPMWQKLRLVAAAGAETSADKRADSTAPAQETLTADPAGESDGQTPAQSDLPEALPDGTGEGDGADAPASDMGDDGEDRPSDMGDDGEEEKKSDLPDGEDTDSQTPGDGEESGDDPADDPAEGEAAPPVLEGETEGVGMDDTMPTDGKGVLAIPSLFAARATNYPYSTILKIAGYGSDYGIGFATDGDAVWNSAKYNLEWDGHIWTKGVSSADGNYDHEGIFTEFYGSGKYAVDEYGEESYDFEISPWYDYDHYLSEGGFVAGSRLLDGFSSARLPRLPNKEFAGWYIRRSIVGETDYFSGDFWPWPDSGGEVFGANNYFAHEGTEVGDETPTTAVTGVDDQIPFDPSADLEQYLEYAIDGELLGSLLPVIGVWKDSSNATATDLKIYTASTNADGSSSGGAAVKLYDYNVDLLGKTSGELESVKTTTFDASKDKYFVRVPFGIDKLNFDFTTFEPGSTVVVENSYKGIRTDYTSSLNGEESTKTYEEGVYNDYALHNPTNTPEDDPNEGKRGYTGTGPARKTFTLGTETTPAYIDLKTYNASDASTCNVITFTVTAPDGSTSKVYTLYVQRLSDPVMMGDPGNSPYGMIYREWPEDEEKRNAAIADFGSYAGKEPNSFKDTVFENLTLNNGGHVYRGRYRDMAWVPGTANLDRDATAIMAYTNSAFRIPDATVVDGLGVAHRASEYKDSTGKDCVQWTLTLTTVDRMGPEIATDDYPGTAYTLSKVDDDMVSLPGNVKPGIYTLSYTYADPYDGAVHSGAENGFSRQVVILPLPGDVDMDGTVTVADGVKLKELLDSNVFDDIGTTTDAVKRLYYYRVCNVNNNNEKVDQYDVALLTGNYATPAYGTTAESAGYYMYLPLTKETINRRPAVKTEGKASLSVDYMGILSSETDTLDPDLRPDYDPQNITPFWMGVHLTGALPESLAGEVTTFTFTLIYDPTYVTPWAPEGAEDLMTYILEQNSQWDGYTLLDSSGSAIVPATHYATKATPALSGREANLRELRFSVQGTGAELSKLADGLLLKVPFRIKAYPGSLMDKDGNAALVDASLGMRDFVVTTGTGVSAWNNARDDVPNAGTTNLATNLSYAGTTQIPIGENKAPGTLVQITDKDGNKVNPVYGEEFTVNLPDAGNLINSTDNGIQDAAKLPPGVTYNWQSKTLTGTPTEAGTYSFVIQSPRSGENIRQFEFQITVDKAPLCLTVQDVSMYYGQDPGKDGTTTERTFTYDPTQIKAVDLTDGKTNGGTAAELSTLLNKEHDEYEAPKISLRTTQAVDGPEVAVTTVPGSYWVMMESGGSKNYKFYYIQPAADGVEEKVSPDFGWATLTVKPRPILVDQLTKEVLGEILVTSKSNQIEGNTASYQKKEFEAATPNRTNGCYGDIPLSIATIVNDDEVVLDYTVMVENLNQIKLSKKEELHDATVADVRLVQDAEGSKNSCYILVNPNASEIAGHPRDEGWVKPTKQTGKALIKAQELSKLEASWQYDEGHEDLDRVYTYGTTLSLNRLSIDLTYLDAQGKEMEPLTVASGDYWNEANAAAFKRLYEERGITFQWVDSEGAAPAAVDPGKVGTSAYTDYYPDMAYAGQHISVKEHNGKWLCITAQGTDLASVYIGPFTVNKKPITIKTVSLRRYYGEANPAFSFRYVTEDLASWDRPDGVLDTKDALKALKLSGYQEPSFAYRTEVSLTKGEDVTTATGVGTRYMLIYGAKSDNYSFCYQCTDENGNVATTTDASLDPDSAKEKADPVLGYAALVILKRPIMVTKIQAPAGSLLFDAESNVIEKATVSADKIESQLPEKDTLYYQWGKDEKTYPELGLTLGGDPILSGDKVTLQYQATFEKSNNTVPYWDLGDKSSIDVTVEIDKLELPAATGKNDNYELIYAGTRPAAEGWTAVRDPSASSDAGGQYKRTDSTGTIVKRSIKSIQVTQSPKLSYTYGGGDDADTGKLDLSTLTVKITYEDNSAESVTYGSVVSGGVETDTFAQKGVTIHWDSKDGDKAKNGEELNVTDYNNRQLVVTGQATPNDPVLVATLASGVKMKVTVAKRALVLKAVDQTRAYGEENGTYEFTFDTAQLASWDAQLLTEKNLAAKGSATKLDTQATSAALLAIDPTFKGPSFDTDAKKDSNTGDYRLYLDSDGAAMANYKLRFENATIHVVKRPVYVTEIKKSPLNSVYQGASTTDVHTVTGYVGGSGNDAKTDFELSVYTGSGLTFAGNNALVGGDVLGIDVSFNYTNTATVMSAAPVHINGMALVDGKQDSQVKGSSNYELETTHSTVTGQTFALGDIHEKRVSKIEAYQQPNLTFDYGDRQLELKDLQIKVTYEDGNTATYNVGNFDLADAYYYSSATIPAKSEWAKIPATYTKVEDNDHLTVKDHNGKYILILAKESGETGAGYVAPIILRNNSSTNGAIQVNPRKLTYHFTAADKVYDTTTATTGTIQLTNVYGTDKIWVDNGTDYTGQSLGDYTFASETTGITFTYSSADVGENILVRVSGIKLLGPDKDNYDIGPAAVTSSGSDVNGRDGAPTATITKADRTSMHEQAPDVTISLTVDEHTNAVKVSVDRLASAFGNKNDRKNSQLHYEYQLVYLDENGSPTGTVTDWQSSPYFGGEMVGDGMAQEGDNDLGDRPALNRGQYVMANVRLCETDNYKASALTVSTDDPAQSVQDAAQAVADAVAAATNDKARTVERVPAPVTWTYTYRVDLYDSTEVKEGQVTTYKTTLVDVWFTDITTYREQREFERLVDNLSQTRYTGYFWDEAKKIALSYGASFDLSQDIAVKKTVTQEDGTALEETVVVNPADPLGGRDLTVYVTTVPRADSAPPIKSMELIPSVLTGRVGDEPVKVELKVTPKSANTKNLRWISSAPNVATVDKNGVITFVGPGIAAVTVQTRNGSVSASMTVRVLGDHPYEESMFNVYYDEAYMEVSSDGLFAPEQTMSRQTMVTLMARLFQSTEQKLPKDAPNRYDDVSDGVAYLEQLDLLDQWGIINGIGDNLFAPDDTATRAEVAVALCQMLMLPVGTDPNAPHAFIDATPENHWAWAYIDALAAAGITVGTGGGRYSPDDPVTRAELATFIAKALATEVDTNDPELVIPVDVTEEHWAYKYILRAVNSGAMLLYKERFD